MTVSERLAFWRRLADEHSGRVVAERATERIAELEQIVGSSATITREDRFVTCEHVERSKGAPVGIGDSFRPGPVWAFAWVNAPRPSETLSLQWVREDGTVERTQKLQVSYNTGGGYRIYLTKRHSAPGRYEVRLLNQDELLIGRRAFTVG